MLYQVKILRFPGTILHPKFGRINLYTAKQSILKELYDSGYPYVEKIEDRTFSEKEIKVVKPPVPKNRNKKKAKILKPPDQLDTLLVNTAEEEASD